MKYGCFLSFFFLPFKPTVSEAYRPAMLTERLKHSPGGRSFEARVNQWRFILPHKTTGPDPDATAHRFFSTAGLWCRVRRCINLSVPGHIRCHDRLRRPGMPDNFHRFGIMQNVHTRNLRFDARLKVLARKKKGG